MTQEKLLAAARTGDVDMIRELLGNAGGTNAKDEAARSALLEAIRAGHVEVARTLLDAGVPIRTEGKKRPLALAVAKNSLPLLELLLKAGADPNARDQLGQTALHTAAMKDERSELLGALVAAGADVKVRDEDGKTPLLVAAEEKSVNNVKRLLEAGADPNVPELERGLYPLHHAIGNAPLLEALLAAGANPSPQDLARRTPLHSAIVGNDVQGAQRLLQAGTNVNARNQRGETPLMLAAVRKDPTLTNLLLKAGANPNALNEEHLSALALAMRADAKESAKLLVAAGADPASAQRSLDEDSHRVRQADSLPLRPSGPNDYGPHTPKVQHVIDFLKSGRLLRFQGHFDDRFMPVQSLAAAKKRARSPGAEEFDWEEDRLAVWDDAIPTNVFQDRRAADSYKKNFATLRSTLDRSINDTLPKEYRSLYDDIYSDMIAFTEQLASFGQLDRLNALVWEAYVQGGWPCGCSGPGLKPGDRLDLSGRKIFVFWRPTSDADATERPST
jgi:ankyrin repeat protein